MRLGQMLERAQMDGNLGPGHALVWRHRYAARMEGGAEKALLTPLSRRPVRLQSGLRKRPFNSFSLMCTSFPA